MTALDHGLFLWLNLGPQAPAWTMALARGASLNLPHWMLAVALTLALAGGPGWRAQAWRVLASVALASGAAHLLKQGLNFPRPVTLGLGTQWLAHGAAAGFPSSHASVAMAFAVSASLAPLAWPARALVATAALLIGWSRIALGLHFPSDVLAAWCLGTLCALAVQRCSAPAARRWPRPRVRG